MSKQLPRHDRFGEYTEDEINEVKEEICMKYKCPYLKDLTKQKYKAGSTTHCAYALLAGKCRNCMPVDCTHYKDKNVKKRMSPLGNYID